MPFSFGRNQGSCCDFTYELDVGLPHPGGFGTARLLAPAMRLIS